MAKTATNPKTGEQVILVDNKWVPFSEDDFQREYGFLSREMGLNVDPDAPEHHYDYRSALASGFNPLDSEDLHWPSKFKTPDHPNRYVIQDGKVTDTITGKAARTATNPKTGDRVYYNEWLNKWEHIPTTWDKITDVAKNIGAGFKGVGQKIVKQYQNLPESAENPLGSQTIEFDPSKSYDPEDSESELTDALVSGGKGVIGTGEAATGLARLLASAPEAKIGPVRISSPFDVGVEVGGVHYGLNPYKTAISILEKAGYDPKATKEALNKLYTPEQQQALQNVDSAKGFFGSMGAMVENPSVLPHMIIESVLPMFLGGATAKEILGAKGFVETVGGKIAPALSAAIGESGVAMGQSAEQISQDTGQQRLALGQSAAVFGTGLGTGALALAGASLAKKMGVADFDTLLATGKTGQTSGSIYKRILAGGFSEGTLEEMPQSMLEQLLINAATGRPLKEGLGKAASQGWTVGTVMGSGANLFGGGEAASGRGTSAEPQATKESILTELKSGKISIEELNDIKEAVPDLAPIIDEAIAEFGGGGLFQAHTEGEGQRMAQEIAQQRTTVPGRKPAQEAKQVFPYAPQEEAQRKIEDDWAEYERAEKAATEARLAMARHQYGLGPKTGVVPGQEVDQNQLRQEIETAQQKEAANALQEKRQERQEIPAPETQSQEGEIVEPGKIEQRQPEQPPDAMGEKVSPEKAKAVTDQFNQQSEEHAVKFDGFQEIPGKPPATQVTVTKGPAEMATFTIRRSITPEIIQERIDGFLKQRQGVKKKTAPESEVVHTMPDGSTMEGPEHVGAAPGSERTTKESENKNGEAWKTYPAGGKRYSYRLGDHAYIVDKTDLRPELRGYYLYSPDYKSDISERFVAAFDTLEDAKKYGEGIKNKELSSLVRKEPNFLDEIEDSKYLGGGIYETNRFGTGTRFKYENGEWYRWDGATKWIRHKSKKGYHHSWELDEKLSRGELTRVGDLPGEKTPRITEKYGPKTTQGQQAPPNAQSSIADQETKPKTAKQFKAGDKVMFNGKVHEIDEINYDDGIASIFDSRNRETVVKDFTQLKPVQKQELIGRVFLERGGWQPITSQREIKRGKQSGKVEVVLANGRKKRVDQDAVRLGKFRLKDQDIQDIAKGRNPRRAERKYNESLSEELKSVERSKIERRIKSHITRWENGPKVFLVENEDQLPDVAKKALADIGEQNKPTGWYDPETKSIYLVRENINSAEEATKFLFHESFHHGIRGVLGNTVSKRRYVRFALDLLRTREAEITEATKPYKFDMEKAEDRMAAVEEFIAQKAESGKKSGVVDRVIRIVKAWVRKVAPRLKVSDAEIRTWIARAGRGVEGSAKTGKGKFALKDTKTETLKRMGLTEKQIKAVISKKFDVPEEKQPVRNAIESVFKADNWTKETAKKHIDKARTQVLDRLHPIEQLGDTAYMLHRMLGNAHMTISTFLQHGKMSWENQVISVGTKKAGFLPWFKKLGGDGRNFLYWVAVQRAEVLESEGREKWLDADTRKKIKEEIFVGLNENQKRDKIKQYHKLNDEFQEWNKNVLDIARESGLLSKSQINSWTKDYYLPFYRVFEDENTRQEFMASPRKMKQHISAQIKHLEGGEAKLGDPVENILKNWSHLIQESQRNMARSTAADVALQHGLAEEVTSGQLSKVIGSQTINKWGVKKKGAERSSKLFASKNEAEAYQRKLGNNYEIVERKTTLTKFGRKEDFQIVSYQKNGKPVYLKVNDPDLFDALSDMNSEVFNKFLMKVFSGAKRLLTAGATLTPAFRIANLIRDTIHNFVVAKSFTPVIDSAVGVLKVMRQSPEYIELMASGGGFGKGWVESGDPKAMARSINKIIKREGQGAAGRILRTPKMVWDFWEKIGHASEMAARVQLYSNLKKKGATQLKAAFEAKDILDFHLTGAATTVRVITSAVPFLNARMQGLDRLYRGAKDNKVGFAVKGMAVAAASLFLWSLYRDDDRYKELEDWEKWQYHHFWLGDLHFRIPKAFEVGAIFSSLFETMGNVATGNEELKFLGDFLSHTLRETFAISPPALVAPSIELYANKSFFTGRPIESEGLKRLPSGYRAKPWTSSTLKALGEKTGMSPVKVEHFLRGHTAAFGTMFLAASDAIYNAVADVPKSPALEMKDIPGIGRFVRSDTRSTKYASRYYEFADEMRKFANEVSYLKKLGDLDKAKKIIGENPDKKKYRAFVRKINRAQRRLSDIRRKENKVWASDLSADEKRAKLNEYSEKKKKIFKKIYDKIYGKRRAK